MNDAAANIPVLLILAGPAGSGKTTLCERMVTEVDRFERVVTTTTRAPRPEESDGIDYHFLSADEFDRHLADNAFLEWAWVHRRNRYGTLASSVLDPLSDRRSLILNVDVQGVEHFRQAAQNNSLIARHLGTVYIDASITELKRRLQIRGETESEIERRMITAARERQERSKFDYLITSGSKDADFAELRQIWRRLQERVRSSR